MRRVSLKDWIDKRGMHEIAEILGVEVSTVGHWRRGHCLPRTEQMREIKKLSRGAVTYDEMIDTYHANKERGAQ